jgi:hypothetical protein
VSGAIAGIANPPANIPGVPPREPAPNRPVAAAEQLQQAAPVAAPTASAAETVTVTNSPPINIVSAETPTPEIALDELKVNQLRRPLPSGLAVLSSAMLGKLMVAIDAEHNVFASVDGGNKWKSVSTPWEGHATRVDLVHRVRGAAQGSLSAFSARTAPPSDASLALKSSGAATAQSSTPSSATGTSLSGTVTDRTGAVIAGASVTAVETATGAAHQVKTDAGGHYAIGGLPPGNYRLEGQSAGFRKREIASVAVLPTGTVTVNLILDVGESTQTVTVEAERADVSAADKKQPKAHTPHEAAPIFEIVTESGDRWTSADGLSWQHN